MKKNMTAFTAALTLLLGMAAAANKIDIYTWTLDQEGRDGWSVKKLIGTKAFGPNRKQVGNVENVIFSPDGKARKLIVTTGGFLDIGETPLAVNWNDAKIGPERNSRLPRQERFSIQRSLAMWRLSALSNPRILSREI